MRQRSSAAELRAQRSAITEIPDLSTEICDEGRHGGGVRERIHRSRPPKEKTTLTVLTEKSHLHYVFLQGG